MSKKEKKQEIGVKKETLISLGEKITNIFSERYKVIRRLGSGGMSCVLLIKSSADEMNEYALKVLDKQAYCKTMAALSEAEVLKKLDHPCIPKIIEVQQDENYVYMVQEYIAGISLTEATQKNGKIDEAVLLEWATIIASTLNDLHCQGLIHRDVKPDNLMLDEKNTIKLIDFGLARKNHEVDKADKKVIGTLSYTAPERFMKKAASMQTDIYGYGATMYFLLTGKKPENMKTEPEESYRIMRQNIIETAPPPLKTVLIKALEVQPQQRYGSFEEILLDLSGNEHQIQNVINMRSGAAVSRAVAVFAVLFLICMLSYL
jgi:serine/threonine-protein kinase